MHLAVVTAVLLLVGILNTVTTVHGQEDSCPSLYDCGDGWRLIDDKRCAKFFDTPKTFDEAQYFCRKLGGDLVSLHDMTQIMNLNCMTRTVHQTYWIGATRSGDGFTYTDETDFDFPEYWSRDQPDNFSGTEDCVESNAEMMGYWNDDDCNDKNMFVCARAM